MRPVKIHMWLSRKSLGQLAAPYTLVAWCGASVSSINFSVQIAYPLRPLAKSENEGRRNVVCRVSRCEHTLRGYGPRGSERGNSTAGIGICYRCHHSMGVCAEENSKVTGESKDEIGCIICS